jgi:nicotinamidase-related amidase
MPVPKLVRAADSALVIIDVQERLAAVMPSREALLRGAGILLEAAARLAVPVIYTEQYPKGLGPTAPELLAKLPAGAVRVEKTAFSACGALPLERHQVVLAGMETHVCVLQTALELAAAGHEVFVAADAVTSRAEANHVGALARMHAAGVIVTNTESVLFEWMRESTHPQFREISKLIR